MNTRDIEEIRNASKIAHDDVVHPSYNISFVFLFKARKLLDEGICCSRSSNKGQNDITKDENNVFFHDYLFYL